MAVNMSFNIAWDPTACNLAVPKLHFVGSHSWFVRL